MSNRNILFHLLKINLKLKMQSFFLASIRKLKNLSGEVGGLKLNYKFTMSKISYHLYILCII